MEDTNVLIIRVVILETPYTSIDKGTCSMAHVQLVSVAWDTVR